MPAPGLRFLVRHLRRLAGERESSSRSDTDLLARFVADRDEAAFEEIVQRHGPLVWAVCRTNLSAADADDAFQATFVVLARRARSIRKPGSLACWLSGVARKTVQSVRARGVRRREVPLDAAKSAATLHDSEANDTRAAIAEEIERLPEKYRLPTLLCYVQGLTNEEAARRLGWPHGTVCGRLSRARDLLRTKLARRGVTLSAGMLATGVVSPPAELLAATLTASTAKTLTGSVIQLAEAVMNAMWLAKIKIAAISLLTVAAIGTGTGWVLVPAVAQDGKTPSKDASKTSPFSQAPAAGNGLKLPEGLVEPVDEAKAKELLREAMGSTKPSPLAEIKPGDDALLKLKKERHRAAVEEMKLRLNVFEAGAKGGTIDVLIGSVERVHASELALAKTSADRYAAVMRAFTVAKAIVATNWARFNFGQIGQQDLELSRYFMFDMQIQALAGRNSFNPNMIGD